MKLVLFNRFFLPDSSATAQMLGDLALHLARGGRDVHVVTSRVPGQREDATPEVTVHRVAQALTGPHGLARRSLAYLAYYRGARAAADRLLAPRDVVVVKTDPPMLSAALVHRAHARGAKVVVWLQDLFPEVAREYGVPGAGGASGALLARARDRSLAAADAVVAIGDAMAERVAALGCVDPARLHVIHNWSDGSSVVPVAGDANPLRRAWRLDGKFVVQYSGNLGRVHEFDTMLAAARRLQSRDEIRFLVVGRGPRLAGVRERVERESIANVGFEPLQERASLAHSLGVGDVHLSVLRPEFEGLVHPSKLYGILAAGRPTIFVGSGTGETARILERTGAGLTVPTGDADGLAAAIVRLRDDAAARRRMGERARAAFELEYDMPVALAKWEALLGA